MKLIIGLGNPGSKYEFTRHNIGFSVVDHFVKNISKVNDGPWDTVKKPKTLFYKSAYFLVAKPQTYMNLSGLSISYLLSFYKINPRDLWVIHDDLDIPLGKLKIRRGGGSSGHHGIESIIKEIKFIDFIKFRVGIGKVEKKPEASEKNLHRREVERYVLSPFTTHEEGNLRKIIKKTSQAIEYSISKGIVLGMNKYN
ncbi:aminoacyl-tRNA hydrolase [Candidatus Gottesmanbacteria bacterium]|nr:aminoacyl-tRNA hydrolase [Candidatus Gottesmanbacteria bacterium]